MSTQAVDLPNTQVNYQDSAGRRIHRSLRCSVPAPPIGLLRTGPGDAAKAARQAADEKILLIEINPLTIKNIKCAAGFASRPCCRSYAGLLQRCFAKSLTYEQRRPNL